MLDRLININDEEIQLIFKEKEGSDQPFLTNEVHNKGLNLPDNNLPTDND